MKSLKKISLLIILLFIIVAMFVACDKPAEIIKVTFTVEGALYKEYNLEYGKGIEYIPEVPSKKGYIGEWNTSDFSEFYTDTTVTAVYTKNFLTLTFKSDNLIIRKTDIEIGENPSSLPKVPDREGYTGAWEITEFTNLTVDTVVRAVYTPIKIQITFKSEDSEDIIRFVDYGQNLIDIPDVPNKAAYSGIWDITEFSQLKNNITVNAVYSPKVITVNFIDADDDTPQTQTYSYEQQLSFPGEQYREGYIFNGWYIDNQYETKANDIVLLESINIYAYWIEINSQEASNPYVFEYEELEDGTYDIAPIDRFGLPENIVLPNFYYDEQANSYSLVTQIRKDAFKDLMQLQSVVIPVGITIIGDNAFNSCQNLSSVTFAERNKLKEIGNYAFYQNSSLESLEIAKTIETIGDYAFYQCTALDILDIPEGNNLSEIRSYAFYNSYGIDQINISHQIVNIGDYAFSGLNNTILNFQGLEKLESVGKFAFNNCWGLHSFNAPKIISIGEGAFSGCMYLSELTIIADIPIADYFGQTSFQNSYEVSQISKRRNAQGEFIEDANGDYELITITRWLPAWLKTVRIREGATNVADYTLNNCFAINNIYIPSSVKVIGKAAFAAESGSNNLMVQGKLEFGPDSQLQEIKERAFYARTSFSQILIPPLVKTIGDEAFRIATRLAGITFADKDKLEYIGSYAFHNTDWYIQRIDGVVYLADIAIGYKGSSSSINLNIAPNTKAIAPYAFAQNANITSVNIPSSVKTINAYAFWECYGINRIIIEQGVEEIYNNAFEKCVALTEIIIPKSVHTIGANIMKGCNSIKTMSVYGDRTLGDFFGIGSYNNSYQISQNQIINTDFVVEIDQENPNKFYIIWKQTKNLYDQYPQKYNVIISDAIDDQGNILPSFALDYLTHSTLDSDYYEINDDGEYIFTLPITREEIETGKYRYVSAFNNSFLSDNPNIQNLIHIQSAFTTDYYIPQSLTQIILSDDIDDADDTDLMERIVKPYSFMNVTTIEEVIFGQGITQIGQGAFLGCSSLGVKVVTDTLTAIPIVFPSSLEVIGSYAFEDATGLCEINYASNTNLKIIGDSAFKNSGLKNLTIPATIEYIGNYAFSNNELLAMLAFNNSQVALEIKDNAFEYCEKITSIIFPDRLVSIGANAFRNNSMLSSINFGIDSNLTGMGEMAFANCIAITTINLPKLMNLDTLIDVFYNCGGVREITLTNTQVDNYHSATLGMLFGTTHFERSYAIVQNDVTYYVPSALTTINLYGKASDYLLQNVNLVKKINLYDTTVIGDYAFSNCSSIEKIELPDTVISIGNYAFNDCLLLESVIITNNSQLTTIGSAAFMNNIALKSFYSPYGVSVIADNTFNNCEQLSQIQIENITKIQEYAFYNCISINTIDLSNDIIGIADYAFYNCVNAEIPYKKFDRLAYVGNFAFYNCIGLKYLHAENIETMGVMVFSGAYNIIELSIPGNTAIGPVFGSVYFENSYAIEQNGYYYVPEALKTIRVSTTASSLPTKAFKDCKEITDIIFLSQTPPVLDDVIFENTSDDLKLFVPQPTKSLYQTEYSFFVDRIYTNPSDTSSFIFNLNDDDTYIVNTSGQSFDGEILFIPAYYEGKPVAKIADNAFANNTAIKEVIVPNTITQIGNSAFLGCIGVSRVSFMGGSNLAVIGNDAFARCDALTTITIPKTVHTIGNYAFAGQRTLNGQNEYMYSSQLNQVVFEENSQLKSIGDYAFYLCNSLTTFSLPLEVQTIGNAAFRNSGLITFIYPEYSFVDTINADTFYGCNNLISIDLPFNLKTIGKNAFAYCSMIAEVNFINSVVTISERAFYNCLSLIDMNFPDGLITIAKEAFRYCATLEYVYIPQTVENIGDYAFNGCSNLYEVELISSDLQYIGENAFLDTLWYAQIIEQSSNNAVVYINNIAYTYNGEMPINAELAIREGTVAIAPGAFLGMTNLIKVILPSSIISIGDSAFYSCSSLQTIEFPNNCQIKEIGKYAFQGTILEEILLPASIEVIDDYAFFGVVSVASINIQEQSALKKIGDYAFAELTNLCGQIVMPTSLEHIGKEAFYRCENLTIEIPEGSMLSYIGSKAFSYTKEISVIFPETIKVINDAFSFTTIQQFIIPAWITVIEKEAFASSSIESIELAQDNELQEIRDMAFFNLEQTSILLSGLTNLKSIGEKAFFNCYAITEIDAKSITDIGKGAFYGCQSLEKLTVNGKSIAFAFDGQIPESLHTINIASGVTEIEQGAFKDMTSLVTLNFPATVKRISEQAFLNAESLENINFEIEESLVFVGKQAFHNTKWLVDHSQGVVYLGKIVYSYKSDGYGVANIISGTTAIAEYAFYQSDVESVYMPISVTAINDSAFENCLQLSSVTIANGSRLNKIGKSAFANCVLLENFTIPLAVSRIGENALAGCNQLQKLDYSSWIQKINNDEYITLGYLFGTEIYENSYSAIQNGATYFIPQSLKEIRILEGSTKINAYAMQNCSYIETIIISISITEIQQSAIEGCLGLTRLTLNTGSQLTIIGDRAFADCSSLTILNLPLNTLSVGQEILNGCNSLEQISFNSQLPYPLLFGLTQYDDSYAIEYNGQDYYAPNSLVSVVIAAGSLSISENAFASSNLQSVSIPLSVETIEKAAFKDAINLSLLIIATNSRLKTINEEAFQNCIGLTEITLNQSIEYIGDSAFYNSINLDTITIANNSCQIGNDAFYGTAWQANKQGEMYVGTTFVGYNGYMPESYTLTLSDDTTDIAAYALANQENLIAINIPSTIKTIGEAAFKGCINLGSVNFATNSTEITYISDECFRDTLLTSIAIPYTIKEIGDYAFYNNFALEQVTFQSGSRLEIIGKSAFQQTGLNAIDVPINVKIIDDYAFCQSQHIETVSFKQSNKLEYIGKNAFEGLSQAEFINTTFENLTIIESHAFKNCGLLTQIIMPSVQRIASESFNGCYSLQSIILTEDIRLFEVFGYCDIDTEARYDNVVFNSINYSVPKSLKTVAFTPDVEEIIDNAILSCVSVEIIKLTQSVKKIGEKAFEGCENLLRIIGMEEVTEIGNSAFKNCIALISTNKEDLAQEFILPIATNKIGANAFENCSGIQKLIIPENSSIEHIDAYAFSGMPNTQFDITPIKNALVVGDFAFKSSSLLESFIANSVISIGQGAFNGCSSLSALSVTATDYVGKIFGTDSYDNSYSVTYQTHTYYLPNGLTQINVSSSMASISDYAFAFFEKTQTINLSNVTSIGKNVFEGNTSLNSVIIPQSVVIIDDFAFKGCQNLLNINLELTQTLTYIGEEVFDETLWYNNLTEGMGDETVYIGRVAYKQIGNIEGILELRNDTIGIAPNAFINQVGITEISLPLTLSAIGKNAFKNCHSIETINTTGNYEIGKLFGSENYIGSYSAVQNGVTYYIPSSLQTINIIQGSTQLINNAFANCSSIINVNIADSIYNIGNNVFVGCTAITNMSVPSKYKLGLYFGTDSYLGSYQALQGNESYYIPNSLKTIVTSGTVIGDSAFQNFKEVLSISISQNAQIIGDYAFAGCEKITSINLRNVLSIGRSALAECVSLTVVDIPISATVGQNILSGCYSINTLRTKANTPVHLLFGNSPYPNSYQARQGNKVYHIPQMLTTINIVSSNIICNGFLQNMSTISTVTFTTSNITKIDDYAFYGLEQLAEIILPSSLTEIGSYAFYNNKQTVFVMQANNVARVGQNAFNNCYKLTSFVSSSITYIGANAFSGCYSIIELAVIKDKTMGEYFGNQMFINSYQVTQNNINYYVPTALTKVYVYGQGTVVEDMFEGMSQVQAIYVS